MILDLDARSLLQGDGWVPLTVKQAAIVECIFGAHLTIVTYDRLISQVWALPDEPENALLTIQVQLCLVRKRCAAEGVELPIEAVARTGYRATERVEIRSKKRAVVAVPVDLVTQIQRLLERHQDHAAADQALARLAAV